MAQGVVGSATASGLAAFTRELDGRAVKEAFGLVEELAEAAEAAANLAFGGGREFLLGMKVGSFGTL